MLHLRIKEDPKEYSTYSRFSNGEVVFLTIQLNNKKMTKDNFCVALAKHISETLNTKICPTKVSEQLLLIELGLKPTDKLIGTYIKEFSSKKER